MPNMNNVVKSENQNLLSVRKKKGNKIKSMFEPMGTISMHTYFIIALVAFTIIIVVWSLITYFQLVSSLFLPTPVKIIQEGNRLFLQAGFVRDILATVYRVVAGFLLAVVIAIPLGLLMGTFKPVEAFFEPVVSFIRYMPASAFIPLFILWIGIGNMEKIAIIFVGSFFSLVLMVAVEVQQMPRELLEAAYTLGSSRIHVLKVSVK